jgi:hypothetical protein
MRSLGTILPTRIQLYIAIGFIFARIQSLASTISSFLRQTKKPAHRIRVYGDALSVNSRPAWRGVGKEWLDLAACRMRARRFSSALYLANSSP